MTPVDFVRDVLFASLKEGLANKVRVILFISANLYLAAVIIFGTTHEYTIPSAVMAFIVDVLLAVSFFMKDKDKSQSLNFFVINLLVFFVLISFGITVPLISLLLVIDLLLFTQSRNRRLIMIVIVAIILLLETDVFSFVPLPIFLGDVPKIDIVNVALYIALLLIILSLIELLSSLHDDIYSNLKKIQSSKELKDDIRMMLMIDGLNYRLSMHTLKNLLLGLDLDSHLRDFINIVFFTAIDANDKSFSGGVLIRGIISTVMYIKDRYNSVQIKINGIESLHDIQTLTMVDINLFISTFFNILKNAVVYVDIHKGKLRRKHRALIVKCDINIINGSLLRVVVSNPILPEDSDVNKIIEKSSQKMSGIFLTSVVLKDMQKGSLNFSVEDETLKVDFRQTVN